MKIEQSKDDDRLEIRSMILNGKESKDVQKHYLLVDGLVYFISNVDDDPRLRLFIPKRIRSFVMTQYHDQNGHMGVQKICLKNFTIMFLNALCVKQDLCRKSVSLCKKLTFHHIQWQNLVLISLVHIKLHCQGISTSLPS